MSTTSSVKSSSANANIPLTENKQNNTVVRCLSLCSFMLTVSYLSLCSIMLTINYLSLCSIMLAGAAFSFSCSSSFLVLKRQNLSSQSEPVVSDSWFRVSVATPRTAPL